MLSLLTFLEMDEIRQMKEAMQKPDYKANEAQKLLASEVTRLIHGEEGLAAALRATEVAKPGAEAELNASALAALGSDIPSFKAEKPQVVGQLLIDLLVALGVSQSKGEMRRLIRGGGLYLNNQKVSDEQLTLSSEDLIEDRLLLVALGKKKKVIISIC
jgi:tyrosyl-tRNA synthetase